MGKKRKLEDVDGVRWVAVADGIELCEGVAESLKHHQIEGIRFMWRHVGVDGKGCMLAHSMGLGKSAQAIIVTCLLMEKLGLKKILLVTPKSTLSGWSTEYQMWSKRANFTPITPIVIGDDTWSNRIEKLNTWAARGGVLSMSYELYGNMVGAYNKYRSHHIPSNIVELLQNPGPDVVICDEGHTIRNQSSGIAASLNMLRTSRRIMLTGTPMQNCLEELWGMIEFVRPGYFPRREFVTYFQMPIQQGQKKTSSRVAIAKMKERAYTLQKELEVFVHRRDQSILLKELPPKEEYVVVCPQSDFQEGLQKRFRAWFMKRSRLVRGGHNTLLYTHVLNKISGHPDLLKATLEEVLSGKRETAEFGWSSELSWAEGVLLNAPSYKHLLLSRSPKMTTLLYIIEYCVQHKEKLLIFSQWTMTLELITKFTKIMAPKLDVWCLKGDMGQSKRKMSIDAFQKCDGPGVFLISTTAGGMGINLNTAHRAVLFDVAFNPAVDQQAVFRCYRYGLQHKVRIYRLITAKMPEVAVYHSCVSKEWLGKKVVDGGTPSRAHVKGHLFADSDLFADPSNPADDDDENEKLWKGEKKLALQEDALLAHINTKMAARGLPLGRMFRHQSLLLEDFGEVAGPEQVRAHEVYKASGGRDALNTMLDTETTLPEATEEEYLNFIDTAAPLPEDIADTTDDEVSESDQFVPDLAN
eukprot:TRINITY_DN23311_c0_g2_i1.p1 TRINITY_DN23311_c0_g2~~TRINITY_DN23311_c0_g2_i1.p1  ORF type:complete len:696 (+),score=276.07 TRINITY_DN23311_c0_g2_i1:32-2119(+)